MKVIIVDDEKHVREGIVLLGNWRKYGIDTILEATDGEEAIKVISENLPEIIFTDMRMPKKDGICLLKWIHSADLTSKTIVVSGYDDFEYMRNAIYYKSFDYLLKPIDPEALNETLERAVTEWREQAQHRKALVKSNKVINEVRPFYLDHLLSGLLTKSTMSQTSRQKLKEEYSIDLTNQKMTVALFSIKPFVERCQWDTELAFLTLLPICNEIIGKRNGAGFKNQHKEDELVLLFWNPKGITTKLKEIMISLHQKTNVRTCVALSKPAFQIADAYASARKVVLKHNLLESKASIIVTSENIINQPSVHLLDYAEEIKWAIQSGSTEKMDTILDRIFLVFETSNSFSLEQMEQWDKEFDILKNHWIKEYEIQNQIHFYKGTDFWKDDGSFSFKKYKEEKRKEFHKLIECLIDVKYKKERKSVYLIEEYIRHNYEKDINLQEIADRFFLSREYISRKFKQEFNETITDYLLKIRMEKAMELLENPHLKIYEIANHVGYQNEKYFSKLFKKFAGVTPNEYRNRE
ncbi:response regulator transcription factor [Fredinandcohnia humi]